MREESDFASRICIDSTGRGRLKVAGESNRFTYQAKAQGQEFTLGIDIPFKGQETLILPLDNSGEKIGGSLYKKVSKRLLKKRRLRTVKLFDEFLLQSADLFSSLRKIQSGKCNAQSCLKGKIEDTENGQLYRSAWSEDYELVVEFKRFSKGIYKSMRVKAVSTQKSKTPLSLDLAIDECQ